MRKKDIHTVKVMIERFEGGYAVVEMEDMERVYMPRALIPSAAREGSVLIIELEGKKSRVRRDDTSALINELWKD